MPPPPTPLSGRYQLLGAIASGDGIFRWHALELGTERPLVAAVVPRERVAPLKGVTHRHLAALIELIRDPDPQSLPEGTIVARGSVVALAEHVPGQTLTMQLGASPLPPFKAVVWALRVTEALQALHGAGGSHGAVSPRSLVVDPAGRAMPPVLSQLVAPSLASYACPERLQGAPPSEADDVWAAVALLYTAVTGSPPFAGPSSAEILKAIHAGVSPLSGHGIEEPGLDQLFQRGFASDRRQRLSELSELKTALNYLERGEPLPEEPAGIKPPRPLPRLFATTSLFSTQAPTDLVFDETSLVDEVATSPALEKPEPTPPIAEHSVQAPLAPAFPGAAPAARPEPFPASEVSSSFTASATPLPKQGIQTPPPPPIKKERTRWAILILLALGAAAAVAVFLLRSPGEPEPGESRKVAATATTPPSPEKAPAKKEKPAERLTVQEERKLCVHSYFEDQKFEPAQDFTFLCEKGDFRDTTSGIFGAIVQEAPDAAATRQAEPPEPSGTEDVLVVKGGVRLPLDLGWYELAAAAILRTGCCRTPAPVNLPHIEGWCPKLEDVVRQLADDSARAMDLAPSVRRFEEAVACLFATKAERPYPYAAPPTPAQRASFERFLQRAAESDAKRSSLLRR